ncbi:F-box only protein 7 [Rana temporaria]|uniref:F-box only protein 7 n=1 Tax=Rana temporaria TaxID=8407 RepID=UPI001AACA78F|nr:F-box only protein 7 [Rana temporaria]XP_040201588.1 F-box only protein 7 [Rana temporaria]
MKLRVRVRGQTGRLELEEEKPTLGDLRRKLSALFLPSLGYSSDAVFTITLNGKDALTEDQNSLESCGIISGDLIVLRVPDSELVAAAASSTAQPTLDQRQPAVSNIESVQPSTSHSDQRGDWTSVTQSLPEKLMASSCHGAVSGKGATVEEELPCCLAEPMLISESVDGKIPHSLESLYLSAGCSSPNDALMVVIHVLMVETGYIVQGVEEEGASMPEGWRHSDGIYKLRYAHPLCGDSSALLACMPMSKLLVINAAVNMNQGVKCTKTLQLPTNSFINFPGPDNNVSSVYRDLQRLSRLFKDQLVYPLLAATRQALELPDVFGLLVLPLELKLRIFRLLDVRSLFSLSTSCKDLHAGTRDPTLWKFLCRRDFRDRTSRTSQTDWKELYKAMYKARLSRLSSHHIFQPLPPPPYLPNPFVPDPFPPNFPYPPGIIGGEYDERPILPIARDPLSLFVPGRRPVMDPFQLVRPRINPNLPGHGGFPPRRPDNRGAFMPTFF